MTVSTKVTLIQDIIPSYRVPVFRHLGNSEGIALTVLYSRPSKTMARENLRNADEISGFCAKQVALWEFGRHTWQPGALWRVLFTRPDVVIAGDCERGDRLVLLLLCRLTRIRLLWFAGGVPYRDATQIREYDCRSRLERWLGPRNPRRILARQADGLVAYSHAARQYFITRGMNPSRLWVAPNSPDTGALARLRAQWLSKPAALAAERARFAPGNRCVVFALGRLNAARKIDVLLRALHELKQKGVIVSLIIVGDGAERNALRALADRLGLEHVFFEGAVYDETDLSRYFMISDIFVAPGIASLAIKMAMAFGKPVVTVDFGLEVHDVQEGVNGHIFPPGRYDILAQTLQDLVASPQMRRNIGDGGLATVRDRINIEQMINGFLQAIWGETPVRAPE